MNEVSILHLFVHVVEQGSFSAAARLLGTTPSAVSRQVSRLEKELNARLFQRTTRKQNLTEAGEIYFHHARRIVTDMEHARLAVARLTNMPSGRLHVAAEADFALAYFAPILPEFLDRYPEVEIQLSMSTFLLDLVDSGIDVAIRIGHLDDSSLVARKIATSRSLICASPKYLRRYGTPAHPGELEQHNCLSFRITPGKSQWSFQQPAGKLDVNVSGRLRTNSLVFLRSAAVADQGIIMIPSWMVNEDLANGHLVPLLEDFPLAPGSTPIHAVFAHNRQLAPKVRCFVDFLAQRTTVA